MKNNKLFPATFLEVLIVIIVYILSAGVAFFSLNPMNDFLSTEVQLLWFTMVTFSVILLVLFLINFIKKSKISFFNSNYSTLFVWLFFMLSIWGVYHILSVYIIGDFTTKEYHFTAPSAMFFLSVAVIGPIAEEIIFRGFILKGLSQNHAEIKSLLVSTILFMFAHSPNEYVYALLMGTVLGMSFLKTRNLAIPIILHITVNSTSILLEGNPWYGERYWLLSILLLIIVFLIYRYKKILFLKK